MVTNVEIIIALIMSIFFGAIVTKVYV